MSDPVQPVRMTDEDVWTLMVHGDQSTEGQAAIKRLAKRMADHIDQEIAERVYGVAMCGSGPRPPLGAKIISG